MKREKHKNKKPLARLFFLVAGVGFEHIVKKAKCEHSPVAVTCRTLSPASLGSVRSCFGRHRLKKQLSTVFSSLTQRAPLAVLKPEGRGAEPLLRTEKEKTHHKGVFLFMCKGYKKDIFAVLLTGFELYAL